VHELLTSLCSGCFRAHNSQHQTQQHHNWIRPIANAELPNEGVQNQSHIGASNQPDQRLPNLLNFSFNNASHSQLDTTRSYLQAQSTGAFLPPSYGPDDSQFQPRFYFNDQNPAITNLPNTESSGWEFQPGQFTESSFPQNEVYDPLLYLSGDGNLHSPQFAEGYFNNNSNAELEPEPPQSKKRRR
jgi:hypothetical protein